MKTLFIFIVMIIMMIAVNCSAELVDKYIAPNGAIICIYNNVYDADPGWSTKPIQKFQKDLEDLGFIEIKDREYKTKIDKTVLFCKETKSGEKTVRVSVNLPLGKEQTRSISFKKFDSRLMAIALR